MFSSHRSRAHLCGVLTPCSSSWEYPGSKLPCVPLLRLRHAGGWQARSPYVHSTYTLRRPRGVRVSTESYSSEQPEEIPCSRLGLGLGLGLGLRLGQGFRVRARFKARVGAQVGAGAAVYHPTAREPMQATLRIRSISMEVLFAPSISVAPFVISVAVSVGVGHAPIYAIDG